MEQAKKLMTVDEFLVWDDGTDTRYELADGVVTAMTPPANPHGRLVARTVVAIDPRLPNGCVVQVEAGVRISEQTFWQADVAVTCQPDSDREINQPALIIEILSPSTRAHDLGRKLNDYKSLSSMREIWLIDSERRWVQVWVNDARGWIGQDHVGAASLVSPFQGRKIGLDEVNRGV
jgi:Uma2 family endonuclease